MINMQLARSVWLSIVGLMMLSPLGCYTRLGSAGDDQYLSSGGEQSDALSIDRGEYDTGYTGDEYPMWEHRPRVGFIYYYPSFWPSDDFSIIDINLWSSEYNLSDEDRYNGTPYGSQRYPYHYSMFDDYFSPYYYTSGYARETGSPVIQQVLGRRENTPGRDAPTIRNDTVSSDRNSRFPADVTVGRSSGTSVPAPGVTNSDNKSRNDGSQRGSSVPAASDRSGIRNESGVKSSDPVDSNARGNVKRDTAPVRKIPSEMRTPPLNIYPIHTDSSQRGPS